MPKINININALGWFVIAITPFAVSFLGTCGYLAAFRFFEFLGL